nr:hypothetical protein [Candidatus Enterovibrio escacola]
MLRFMQGVLVSLYSYLIYHQVRLIGIAFVDSSKIQVYHNLRIFRH